MEANGGGSIIVRAAEIGGAFLSGLLGIRAYHRARLKSESEEFRIVVRRVNTMERRIRELDELESTVKDHERRILDAGMSAERDHREVMKMLERHGEKLDRLFSRLDVDR